MKSEAGDHGFSRLRVLLVKDEVSDTVIYRHPANGVNRLKDMRMMPYDGRDTSFG